MARRSIWFFFLAALFAFPIRSWSQARPTPNVPNVPPRTFSIRGTVRNNDTSQPIEMVRVDLKRFTGETVATNFTRSNGDFEFGGLNNGVYYIVVDEKGYEPVREGVEIVGSSRSGIFIFLHKPLELRPAAPGNVISAHELSLPQKARDAAQKGVERLYTKNDYKGSLPLFQRAIAAATSYYEAYYHMGVAYMHLDQTSDAEHAFRKSIELSNNTYALAHVDLAAMLSNTERFSEAEPLARRAVELDANSWNSRFELTRALLGLNRVDAAEKTAEETRARKADFAPLYLLMANMHIRKRDTAALMQDLDTYLKLEPSGPASEQARHTREQLQQSAATAKDSPTNQPPKP